MKKNKLMIKFWKILFPISGIIHQKKIKSPPKTATSGLKIVTYCTKKGQ
jgi:hypothetical protein